MKITNIVKISNQASARHNFVTLVISYSKQRDWWLTQLSFTEPNETHDSYTNVLRDIGIVLTNNSLGSGVKLQVMACSCEKKGKIMFGIYAGKR